MSLTRRALFTRLLVVAALSGCVRQNIVLPEKPTPAVTRMSLALQIDDAVVKGLNDRPTTQYAEGATPPDDGTVTRGELEAKLDALLRAELAAHRVAVPVRGDNADVRLTGRLSLAPTVGVQLTWRAHAAKDQSLVVGGVAQQPLFTGDFGQLSDLVLLELLKTDIDRYHAR